MASGFSCSSQQFLEQATSPSNFSSFDRQCDSETKAHVQGTLLQLSLPLQICPRAMESQLELAIVTIWLSCNWHYMELEQRVLTESRGGRGSKGGKWSPPPRGFHKEMADSEGTEGWGGCL